LESGKAVPGQVTVIEQVASPAAVQAVAGCTSLIVWAACAPAVVKISRKSNIVGTTIMMRLIKHPPCTDYAT
jgi:hypothetical protein